MGATQTRLSGAQLLWQAYRTAFREFEREAKRLAEINAQRSYNPAEAEKALSRLEQARLAYNNSRDLLAAALMTPAASRTFLAIPAGLRDQAHVRNIAELFWEFAGKPQGTAEDDWYRAERVVCCAR
jgi:hypothetical protein